MILQADIVSVFARVGLERICILCRYRLHGLQMLRDGGKSGDIDFEAGRADNSSCFRDRMPC